ncbi:MAG: AmmeMemoRadiSam system protein B [Chloroflexota bacterium]|nr:AmmeMemoRadiSam system protein B [Chloroflexota bacterium]
MVVREPIVAGQFYPASRSTLEAQIKGFINKTAPKRDAIGLVSPHAGYIYSGAVTGEVISRIRLKDTFIILGPNHRGTGKPFSIMTGGSWKTPLGEVEIDSRLAKHILARSAHLEEDEVAHLFEHSIEVQIPFLQYLRRDVKIVPIVLSHARLAVYKEIGIEIAESIKELGSEAVIIASSDMTHYESRESARQKDTQAIDAILELNEDELMSRIKELDISMCGYAPTIALISAARVLGAKQTELVSYLTSGDHTGDYSSVVGYAGILIS